MSAKPSLPIGKIGVWTSAFERHPASRIQEAAAELQELGYGAIFYAEATGRESLTQGALLLAATSRIVIASGIANIYARDPFSMVGGQKTLSEAYPNRFLLGLGVSHTPFVKDLRGHDYVKPIEKMTSYLDGMDQAHYGSVAPAATYRVLAALRPKMMQLAAKRTDGAHSYNVPPEHTKEARQVLGSGPLLCVEQAVVLETDAAKARAIARQFLEIYLSLPNYTNNFLRFGYTEEDFKRGGSDRLIDGLVAWGDMESIRQRIRAHQDAGADHVCVQALSAEQKALPMKEWRELAGALIAK